MSNRPQPDPPARAVAETNRRLNSFWLKLTFELGALALLLVYFGSMSD